jgi:hypothetical protein
LEACDPTGALGLQYELGLIKAAAKKGVTAGNSGATDTAWSVWTSFCQDLYCDPLLQDIQDPLPLLQIFAQRYRVGTISPSRSPVKSRTVEGALQAVGQTFASLGYADPRLQPSGKLDLRLQCQLQGYSKLNPPPTRVKPIPFQIIHHVIQHCYGTTDARMHTLAHMVTLAFFFLLRPGEYAYTDNEEAAPFRLCDIHLLHNSTRLDVFRCPEHQLTTATHVALEFTKQKNGVRGELVGLGRSAHPYLCPVKVMIWRIVHLRIHRAHPTMPIYQYHTTTTWQHIATTDITRQLRAATTVLGQAVGITPADISVRSLRSSGAMALLCAEVDTDRIRLLGRWRSDEMLRYLHVQALPIVAPLANLMVQHGYYTLLPNQPIME